ncbi:alpha/beta hydrolase [Nisaea sp.]|uniref:alpha/beta hydrolase n=1 Tax=Nisaea sp. TaxID=2024842 RepID=UPI0032EB1188
MSDARDLGPVPTIESTGGTAAFFQMADGVRIRVAQFPAPAGKAAGTVLMLTGFTEFIEKGLESVAALRARGFGVITFDWRGQGLSDRLLPYRRKGHIPDMQHFLNDLEEVLRMTRFAELPGPHVIMGHSMGGHLALRAAHDHPGLFDRAILCAPMADILTGACRRMLAYGLAKAAVSIGLGESFIPGAGPYVPGQMRYENNPLTTDRARFNRIQEQIDANPDVALGGPTFSWVYSAFRSIRLTKRSSYLSKIRIPVLILSAGRERIVSNAGQREVADMLPDVRMVTFADGAHELLLECDAVRHAVWAEIDGFLKVAEHA